MNNSSNVTALHFAAQRGDVVEIVRLISAGADVNALDENGNTPLKYASAEPHPAAVRKLLDCGASAAMADLSGFTPVHCAAGHGFYPEAIEIAETLIKHGADLNARSTKLGFVPLHEATGARSNSSAKLRVRAVTAGAQTILRFKRINRGKLRRAADDLANDG